MPMAKQNETALFFISLSPFHYQWADVEFTGPQGRDGLRGVWRGKEPIQRRVAFGREFRKPVLFEEDIRVLFWVGQVVCNGTFNVRIDQIGKINLVDPGLTHGFFRSQFKSARKGRARAKNEERKRPVAIHGITSKNAARPAVSRSVWHGEYDQPRRGGVDIAQVKEYCFLRIIAPLKKKYDRLVNARWGPRRQKTPGQHAIFAGGPFGCDQIAVGIPAYLSHFIRPQRIGLSHGVGLSWCGLAAAGGKEQNAQEHGHHHMKPANCCP
jgi:hypothetical protein